MLSANHIIKQHWPIIFCSAFCFAVQKNDMKVHVVFTRIDHLISARKTKTDRITITGNKRMRHISQQAADRLLLIYTPLFNQVPDYAHKSIDEPVYTENKRLNLLKTRLRRDGKPTQHPTANKPPPLSIGRFIITNVNHSTVLHLENHHHLPLFCLRSPNDRQS